MSSVTTRSRTNIVKKKEIFSPSRSARAPSCSSSSSASSSNSIDVPSKPRRSICLTYGPHLNKMFLPKNIPQSDFVLPDFIKEGLVVTPKEASPKVTAKTAAKKDKRGSSKGATGRSPAVAAPPTVTVLDGSIRDSLSPPPLLEKECYIDEEKEAPPPPKRRCIHAPAVVNKQDLRKKIAAKWKGRLNAENGEAKKLSISVCSISCRICRFKTLSASSFIAHLSDAHETSLLQQGLLLRCSCCGTYVKNEEEERNHREEFERAEETAVGRCLEKRPLVRVHDTKKETAVGRCPEKWTTVAIRPSHAANLLQRNE